MKTNKSYTKRIKVTRNGTLVARKPGQDHFNAKERGRTKGVKKRANVINVSNSIRRSFLSATSN
jgi:ribosomal protein L35